MKNLAKGLGLSTLVLGGAMGATLLAQAPATDQSAQSAPAAASQTANPDDASTYATGKPLANDSKEGFWGHMNPFARKKWVRREVDPIRDRTNELDQLQAKNANDIKDVDKRAQAGINNAMMAANTADQHAQDAANRANAAQTTATGADQRTTTLNGTVANLDQYQSVNSTDVPFASGRTALGPKGKEALDDMASKLQGEKGYIIEVQGYSKHGVASSQAMADAVARYLVTEHQVPLYRIYRTGLGKGITGAANTAANDQTAQNTQTASNEEPITNGVRVTLLHNSLASMNEPAAPDAPANNNSYAPQGQQQQSAPAVNQ
ncbi:MAG TPA: OmpA family protein [Acidobacteriaceae bacterium]|nr:OmpA family protein [Acidobacteriaceae bacterium]